MREIVSYLQRGVNTHCRARVTTSGEKLVFQAGG